jgi:hypothetical protein
MNVPKEKKKKKKEKKKKKKSFFPSLADSYTPSFVCSSNCWLLSTCVYSTGSRLWFALDGTHCSPPGVYVRPYSTRAPRLAFAAGGSVVIRRHRPSRYVRCDHANSNDTPGQSALYGGHPVSETRMNVPKRKKKKKKKKKETFRKSPKAE